jgi:hypothetical protein
MSLRIRRGSGIFRLRSGDSIHRHSGMVRRTRPGMTD